MVAASRDAGLVKLRWRLQVMDAGVAEAGWALLKVRGDGVGGCCDLCHGVVVLS